MSRCCREGRSKAIFFASQATGALSVAPMGADQCLCFVGMPDLVMHQQARHLAVASGG